MTTSVASREMATVLMPMGNCRVSAVPWALAFAASHTANAITALIMARDVKTLGSHVAVGLRTKRRVNPLGLKSPTILANCERYLWFGPVSGVRRGIVSGRWRESN